MPRDDAPHTGVNTEWWYYNGHLNTGDERRYDFHYVVFQISQPDLPPVEIAHLAITDPQRGVFSQEQRVVPVTRAAKEGEGFSFDLNGWKMSGYAGEDRLAVDTEEYGFNIQLASEKPPVLHGGTGLVDLEEAGESYYYSRTRYDIRGTISVDGDESGVTGKAWFDHQWGNFRPRDIGWDWFALQLDDGADIMLTVLRDAGNQTLESYGTYVAPDGSATNIEGEEFDVTATDSWKSPASGITYPVGWRVRLPERGIGVTVTPVLQGSEFDSSGTTQNYYWEGGVDVSGTHSGEGFVELTGYGPPAGNIDAP